MCNESRAFQPGGYFLFSWHESEIMQVLHTVISLTWQYLITKLILAVVVYTPGWRKAQTMIDMITKGC